MIAKRRCRVGAIAAVIAIALAACLLPSMALASGDSPKITLRVIDEHDQPVKGVEMVLMGTNSGDPSQCQEIAKAVSDENGDAKFYAENLIGLAVGAYLDCDPVEGGNYEWALAWAGNSGSVGWIADGASIYMNVESDREWASNPSATQVRIVSGYDKLVNAEIIGNPNHSAWITAGGTAGFSVEFALLVK